ARSWSIPSENPYEEAAQQLFEQAPHFSEYVLREHVLVFVPEFEHPKDLVPPEDEAPASLLPPGFLSPRPTMAHGVNCSYVKTRLQDTERRMMAALELVNLRKDRAAVRAEIEVLRSERLAYEQKDDFAVQHIMRTQALEAGARDDTLEDTGSSS
nr:hypothetical protein [Tanacetum cinerariifolium]